MTKSTFYVSPGLSNLERAEKISNRPCYCADPEAQTSCATCFAKAHLDVAVGEAMDVKVMNLEAEVLRWKEVAMESAGRAVYFIDDAAAQYEALQKSQPDPGSNVSMGYGNQAKALRLMAKAMADGELKGFKVRP